MVLDRHALQVHGAALVCWRGGSADQGRYDSLVPAQEPVRDSIEGGSPAYQEGLLP